VIIGWAVAVVNAGGALLPVDQRVLEELARGRTPELTSVMTAVAELGSGWGFVALGWATILVLAVTRHLRRLLVLLGAAFLVQVLAHYLANGILEQASPLRPAGIVALVGLARIYLAIDTPTGVLVASVIGVTIPLVAFWLLCPDEVFPVTYRRGRTAHLDVGGRRGEAIRRALHDQLGVIAEDVQPFALEGSAGSTPLRVTVKGDPETWLFAKLYARSHLRADRSYKLGPAVWAAGGREAVQHRAPLRAAGGLRLGADAADRRAQPRALRGRRAHPRA
jgi:hypothetical protein